MALTHWTTLDGERMPIGDMTASHINNCIKHLERRVVNYGGELDDEVDDPIYFSWLAGKIEVAEGQIKDFQAELERRDLKIKWL